MSLVRTASIRASCQYAPSEFTFNADWSLLEAGGRWSRLYLPRSAPPVPDDCVSHLDFEDEEQGGEEEYYGYTSFADQEQCDPRTGGYSADAKQDPFAALAEYGYGYGYGCGCGLGDVKPPYHPSARTPSPRALEDAYRVAKDPAHVLLAALCVDARLCEDPRGAWADVCWAQAAPEEAESPDSEALSPYSNSALAVRGVRGFGWGGEGEDEGVRGGAGGEGERERSREEDAEREYGHDYDYNNYSLDDGNTWREYQNAGSRFGADPDSRRPHSSISTLTSHSTSTAHSDAPTHVESELELTLAVANAARAHAARRPALGLRFPVIVPAPTPTSASSAYASAAAAISPSYTCASPAFANANPAYENANAYGYRYASVAPHARRPVDPVIMPTPTPTLPLQFAPRYRPSSDPPPYCADDADDTRTQAQAQTRTPVHTGTVVNMDSPSTIVPAAISAQLNATYDAELGIGPGAMMPSSMKPNTNTPAASLRPSPSPSPRPSPRPSPSPRTHAYSSAELVLMPAHAHSNSSSSSSSKSVEDEADNGSTPEKPPPSHLRSQYQSAYDIRSSVRAPSPGQRSRSPLPTSPSPSSPPVRPLSPLSARPLSPQSVPRSPTLTARSSGADTLLSALFAVPRPHEAIHYAPEDPRRARDRERDRGRSRPRPLPLLPRGVRTGTWTPTGASLGDAKTDPGHGLSGYAGFADISDLADADADAEDVKEMTRLENLDDLKGGAVQARADSPSRSRLQRFATRCGTFSRRLAHATAARDR